MKKGITMLLLTTTFHLWSLFQPTPVFYILVDNAAFYVINLY